MQTVGSSGTRGGGSGGTPGGSDTQVQYNNAGAFGGITGATTDGTALTLVAPVLGTPASGTLTNCTGLPAAGVVGTAAILGANTFTALQTITQAAANAGIIASTGYSLTGADATTMLSFAGTWNTSGTPSALKIAITNTASNSASKVLDLLGGAAGATSLFSVNASGNINLNVSQAVFFHLEAAIRATTTNLYLDQNILNIRDSGSTGAWTFTNTGTLSLRASNDTWFLRRAAATWQFGNADAASPVAQTLATQGSRSGTDTNVGGASLTIQPGIGTGTGTPSNLVLNGIVGTTTGAGAQAVSAAITIAGVATGKLPSIVLGSAALATDATDGFLYIPSCAGTPTGTPTAQTGRVPMVFDTANNKFYIYDGSWLGGTTPGAFV